MHKASAGGTPNPSHNQVNSPEEQSYEMERYPMMDKPFETDISSWERNDSNLSETFGYKNSKL